VNWPSRRRWQAPQARSLANEEVLTQYGSCANPIDGCYFRNHPRLRLEEDVSLLLGRLTVEQAKSSISGAVIRTSDGVRYTTVGALRHAGFVVAHTPTAGNPRHVSARANSVWTAAHQEAFDAVFSAPTWQDGKGPADG
jgi:hypothetical protein